jgi:hypothetical protein
MAPSPIERPLPMSDDELALVLEASVKTVRKRSGLGHVSRSNFRKVEEIRSADRKHR